MDLPNDFQLTTKQNQCSKGTTMDLPLRTQKATMTNSKPIKPNENQMFKRYHYGLTLKNSKATLTISKISSTIPWNSLKPS